MLGRKSSLISVLLQGRRRQPHPIYVSLGAPSLRRCPAENRGTLPPDAHVLCGKERQTYRCAAELSASERPYVLGVWVGPTSRKTTVVSSSAPLGRRIYILSP